MSKGNINAKGKARIKPTLTWKEAPDIIGAEELAKILGVGKQKAKEYFKLPGFPIIPLSDGDLKADKEAVKMFFQGFRIKDKPKEALLYQILQELKKINKDVELKQQAS